MTASERLAATPHLELPPGLEAKILTELREKYGHYRVSDVLRFGSSLYEPKYKDIDLLVIVNSGEVVFRPLEIDVDGQHLDVKLVGKGFIDFMLQKQWVK